MKEEEEEEREEEEEGKRRRRRKRRKRRRGKKKEAGGYTNLPSRLPQRYYREAVRVSGPAFSSKETSSVKVYTSVHVPTLT